MISADKANIYKLKTSAHGDTLPPPSTIDSHQEHKHSVSNLTMTCFLRPRFLKSTHEARRGGAGAGETAYEMRYDVAAPSTVFTINSCGRALWRFRGIPG
jgi:hypothetical protein